MDENQGLSIEELKILLETYFYTKEEQEDNSLKENDFSSSNTSLLIEKLDEVKEVNQVALNLQYFNTVVVAGILILFLYYRFLSHFRERWF